MLIKRNVLTAIEQNTLIYALDKLKLPLYEKNIHTKLDDSFAWTDTICKLNVQNLNKVLVRYVISVNSKDEQKNIIGWHTDSDVKNEMTCILYLKGDTSKGGELEVNNKTYAFMNNALFCMKSHLRHRAKPYYGESTRLAIKWRWTTND